jgi:hypothetical protein
MKKQQVTPYGSWKSPIKFSLTVTKISFSQLEIKNSLRTHTVQSVLPGAGVITKNTSDEILTRCIAA